MSSRYWKFRRKDSSAVGRHRTDYADGSGQHDGRCTGRCRRNLCTDPAEGAGRQLAVKDIELQAFKDLLNHFNVPRPGTTDKSRLKASVLKFGSDSVAFQGA